MTSLWNLWIVVKLENLNSDIDIIFICKYQYRFYVFHASFNFYIAFRLWTAQFINSYYKYL